MPKPGVRLDEYSSMIVSKYFKTKEDFKNLELACKKFGDNIEKFRYNPIPLTNKKIRDLFPNLETQHVYSSDDKIFTDGKITKIYFVSENITVDAKDFKKPNKKYNWMRLQPWNRNLLYKDIESQYVYSSDDIIYNDGKINEHVMCMEGRIKDVAFRHYWDNFKKIIIKDTVTEIGRSAFANCKSLESVLIENGVRIIGDYAFRGCKNLKKIVIPESVTTIGKGAFGMCDSLERINIPKSVTAIGESAFNDCKNLKVVNLEGVRELETSLFIGCENLTEIIIPSNLQRIGAAAFGLCKKLKTVYTKGGELSDELKLEIRASSQDYDVKFIKV